MFFITQPVVISVYLDPDEHGYPAYPLKVSKRFGGV